MQSELTISGLIGARKPSGPCALTQILPNISNSSARVLDLSGVWRASTSSLVLRFNSTLEPFVPYVLSFQVRNQAEMQDAPSISIELSGSIAVLRQRIRSQVGNAAPLLIGGFSIKNISQSSATPNALNTLSVTLASNIYWPPSLWESRVFIVGLSGLTGSQTDTNSILVEAGAPDGSGLPIVAANASWERTAGRLEMRLLPNATVIPGRLMTFSFHLINPSRAHSSGPVFVWAASNDEAPNVTLASYAMVTRAPELKAAMLVGDFLLPFSSQTWQHKCMTRATVPIVQWALLIDVLPKSVDLAELVLRLGGW